MLYNYRRLNWDTLKTLLMPTIFLTFPTVHTTQ